MFKKILVATDGSALADLAVAQGISLAAQTRAEVTFLTVTEPFHFFTTEADQIADTEEEYAALMTARAGRIIGRAMDAAGAAEVTASGVHLEDDHPHEVIMATARREHCDLIVMASHGRGGLSALVLGSETMKVLTQSTIPVLVVRAEGMEAIAQAGAGVAQRAGRMAGREHH